MSQVFGRRATGYLLLAAMALLMVPLLRDLPAIPQLFGASKTVERRKVWDWGWNGLGQLGNGSTSNSLVPVQVPGLTGVQEISAGYAHTLAASGTSGYAWGWNVLGQLGDGTTVDRLTPVAIDRMDEISAGLFHSLGVRDGRLFAWGWNGLGQLGDGTKIDRRSPLEILSSGVIGIAAGTYHSLASVD